MRRVDIVHGTASRVSLRVDLEDETPGSALSSPRDEDLLLSIRAGDTDRLGLLVARWQEPLYRFAYRLLERSEDARDVCQETFLRVLTRADRFEPGARFSTWMYQIALNLCRDQIRRRRRWGLIVQEAAEPESAARGARAPAALVEPPSARLERDRRREAVQRGLRTLPAEQREILVLKEFEGLKFREIAELVGCPESTVKSRLYQGLVKLRAALEGEGIRDAG